MSLLAASAAAYNKELSLISHFNVDLIQAMPLCWIYFL